MIDSKKEQVLRKPEEEFHIVWGGISVTGGRIHSGYEPEFILESKPYDSTDMYGCPMYHDREYYKVKNLLNRKETYDLIDPVALAKALRVFSDPGDQYSQIWDAPYTEDLSREIQDLHRAFLTLNNAIIALGRRYSVCKWGDSISPFGPEDYEAISGIWFPWDFEGWDPKDGANTIIPGYTVAQGTIRVLDATTDGAELELDGEKFQIGNQYSWDFEAVEKWLNIIQGLSKEGTWHRAILDTPYEEYKEWDETYTYESEDGFRRDYTSTEHKVQGSPLYIQKFKRLLALLNGAKVEYLKLDSESLYYDKHNLLPFGLLSISHED